MRFDERRLAHSKEQIGNAVSAADHSAKKLVDNLFVHEKLAARPTASS
jgi:hypothetical protein